MINNQDKLLMLLLRIVSAVLLLVVSGWAGWVTTTINKHTDVFSDIRERLVRIEQKLTDESRHAK